jgi:bacterioferritin-associated ferredoxin
VIAVWVCLCEAVTSGVIGDAIDAGARTIKDVGDICGAGIDCGKCKRTIALLLQQRADTESPEKGLLWRTTRRS